MSVTWTAGYAATTPYPMTHARILYTPASGAATASSEVEGFEAALALNPDTYSYWVPSATPATWEVGFNAVIAPIAARRNLLRYSEAFENAVYVKINLLAFGSGSVSNATTSPNGYDVADLLVEDTDVTVPHAINQIATFIAGNRYTLSVYAKAQSARNIRIDLSGTAFGPNSASFDTTTGDVLSSGGGVTTTTTPVGDGWFRFSTSKVCVTSATANSFLYMTDGTNATYTGDGVSGVYLWGAQLEVGPAPTLYQPVTSDYPAADTYVPNAVDAVGIAAHSLAGQSVAVDTWDGAAWVEQVPAFAVTDNGPLLMLFQEVTTSRVRLRVDGIPSPVGVIYAGKALVMPQKAYVGLGQINLKRRTEYKINQTEGGLWAGRSIARVSLIAAYQWTHLTDAFYLANVEPFSFSARQYPFFLAARPSGYPEETTYAWVAADIAPERMGVLDFCSVGFEAIGYSRA